MTSRTPPQPPRAHRVVHVAISRRDEQRVAGPRTRRGDDQRVDLQRDHLRRAEDQLDHPLDDGDQRVDVGRRRAPVPGEQRSAAQAEHGAADLPRVGGQEQVGDVAHELGQDAAGAQAEHRAEHRVGVHPDEQLGDSVRPRAARPARPGTGPAVRRRRPPRRPDRVGRRAARSCGRRRRPSARPGPRARPPRRPRRRGSHRPRPRAPAPRGCGAPLAPASSVQPRPAVSELLCLAAAPPDPDRRRAARPGPAQARPTRAAARPPPSRRPVGRGRPARGGPRPSPVRRSGSRPSPRPVPPARPPRHSAGERRDRQRPVLVRAAVRSRQVGEEQVEIRRAAHHGGERRGHRVRIAPDVGVVVERVGQRHPFAERRTAAPRAAPRSAARSSPACRQRRPRSARPRRRSC